MDKDDHRQLPTGAGRPQSGTGAAYDAEAMQGRAGETPVFERGRTADLDGNFDDEIGMPANAGFEGGSTYASRDDGQYGMNHRGDDPATGQSDPSLLGEMGMGLREARGGHSGFDDEDERGSQSAPGYEGDMGDPESADGLSGSGASYGAEPTTEDGGVPLLGEFGVGAGYANPEEPGYSNDEDSLLDDRSMDRVEAGGGGGGGIEMPPPSPGSDIPQPVQPGYNDDGNDFEVEIPVPQESDIPGISPNPPGR